MYIYIYIYIYIHINNTTNTILILLMKIVPREIPSAPPSVPNTSNRIREFVEVGTDCSYGVDLPIDEGIMFIILHIHKYNTVSCCNITNT